MKRSRNARDVCGEMWDELHERIDAELGGMRSALAQLRVESATVSRREATQFVLDADTVEQSCTQCGEVLGWPDARGGTFSPRVRAFLLDYTIVRRPGGYAVRFDAIIRNENA